MTPNPPKILIEVRVMQGKKVLLKYQKAAVVLSLAKIWFEGAKRIVEGYW
jgi:hypothetical protein